MKLYNITEVNDFLDVIPQCSGGVYLKSDEGDVFNLKSELSQYIALGRLISDHGDGLELFCDRPEDEAKFLRFFHEHPDTV